MNNLDLDINNYDLDDLLNLFKLDYNFTEDDLKKTKRKVLLTHPDKTGLEKKYFLFFMKAYEMVSQIYYFRGKRKRGGSTEYVTDDMEHLELIKSLDGKSIKEFNEWFNKMFDSVKLIDDEVDTGYGEWMKNSKIEEQEKVQLRDFGKAFEKRKRECKEIIKYNGIKEVNINCGTNLVREKQELYNSEIFSKLKYEDLRRAHTESVIPVTNEDYERVPKFKNVNDYKIYRNNASRNPLTMEESNKYLNKKNENETKRNMERAFSLLKRDEEIERAQDRWWNNLKRLKAGK
tara:strand:+ start:921 stop:1790 length:870 start_codon:yes stop_codon:yes gene_type:complete